MKNVKFPLLQILMGIFPNDLSQHFTLKLCVAGFYCKFGTTEQS